MSRVAGDSVRYEIFHSPPKKSRFNSITKYLSFFFFLMIEWAMNCEPFSRNFSLIPAKIGFKYRMC